MNVAQLRLQQGRSLELAWTSLEAELGLAWAAEAPGRHGVLALVVEGVPAGLAAAFRDTVIAALEAAHGTPASSLQRALRAGCERLERAALHRHALSPFGTSALLIEPGPGRQAYLAQIAPAQAYLLDADGLRALPPEPVSGAGRVISPLGRQLAVEIELERIVLRDGATLLLCTSTLAEELPRARLERLLRRPLSEIVAGAATPARGRRALSEIRALGVPRLAVGSEASEQIGGAWVATGRPAVAIRHTDPMPERRGRLFDFTALAGASAGRSRRTAGDDASLPRVRLEPWGIERERRYAPLLRAIERLLPPSRRTGSRRGGSRRLILGTALAIGAGGALAWYRHRRLVPAAAPPPQPDVAATAAPLAGRTLLATGTGQPGLAALAVPAPPGTGTPTLYVLDTAHRLLVLDPAMGDGPPRVLAPPPVSGEAAWELLAAGEQGLLWLDGATLRLLAADGTLHPVPVRGGAWRRPVAIAVYAGNLYVLDVPADAPAQIWRHAGTSGGFESDPVPWAQPSATGALAGATGFAIDGQIWVARADGAILRLAGGRQEPFALSGLAEPVRATGAIATSANDQALYVVDTAARRVLQLGKDGRLEQEVANVFPPGEQVHGLWVDEPSGRVLVLTDARLQEVLLPR